MNSSFQARRSRSTRARLILQLANPLKSTRPSYSYLLPEAFHCGVVNCLSQRHLRLYNTLLSLCTMQPRAAALLAAFLALAISGE